MSIWLPQSDANGRAVDPRAHKAATENASRLLSYRHRECSDETIHLNALEGAVLATATKPHEQLSEGFLYTAVFRAVNRAIRHARTLVFVTHERLDNFSGADVVSAIETHITIKEALARLRPEDRVLVLDRFCSGRSWREIGRSLGISEDAARKRWERARATLRRHMSGDSDGSGTDMINER